MHHEILLAQDERLDEVNEKLRLIQKKNALAFGTDAFLLSAFLRPAPRERAAELGCGNGIISLLAAARGRFSHITAIEIQPEMADLTARNVALNSLTDRIAVQQNDVRRLNAAALGGEVCAVFANPPYMRTDSGLASPHSAKQTARHETDGGIAEFTAAAARCLKYGGLFYTVYRPDRLESLFAALHMHKLAPKRMVFVHDNPTAAPAMVLLEAKKGAGEGLVILPPLFLHENTGDPALSPRAQQIYQNGIF
ncbi:MAG: methyltransferase [Clostridia bacterium]|nr:methyltransferase [Clostridia bacterium]